MAEHLDIDDWLGDVSTFVRGGGGGGGRHGFLVRNRAYDLVHDGGSYSCLLGAAAASTAVQDDLFRSAGLGIAVRSDWVSGTEHIAANTSAAETAAKAANAPWHAELPPPTRAGAGDGDGAPMRHVRGAAAISVGSMAGFLSPSLPPAPPLGPPLIRTRDTLENAKAAISKELIWKVGEG